METRGTKRTVWIAMAACLGVATAAYAVETLELNRALASGTVSNTPGEGFETVDSVVNEASKNGRRSGSAG